MTSFRQLVRDLPKFVLLIWSEMMREASHMGGFEFIPTPSEYYNDPVIAKLMKEHMTEVCEAYRIIDN